MKESDDAYEGDLSQAVKREAEKQRVTVELTEEQLNSLQAAWNDGDPKAPAQITFVVQGREVAHMAVAGYRYRGDTCCV